MGEVNTYKLRRKLMCANNIVGAIKDLSIEIANRHKISIRYMETDQDHIHYMIETAPNIRKGVVNL